MLPNGRQLGVHLPLGTGMVKAADRAAAIGASAVQVFTDNPTAWRRRETLPRELPAFRDRLAGHGIELAASHAPYLVNLAGPDPDLAARSIDILATELRVAQAWGVRLVNVHIGSHRGDGAGPGIDRLARATRATFDQVGGDADDVVLVFENGSGGGFGLGASIEELAAIDAAVAAAGVPRDRFGFCLDTAHLWGAGYAIDTATGVDETTAAFAAGPGLDRLRLVHLNDTSSGLGSRHDRHEHIGAGRIGSEGLARFVLHPDLGTVPCLLETPGMDEGYDAVNLARVRDLEAGRPLDALPANAFLTRSSRSSGAPAEDDEPTGSMGAA